MLLRLALLATLVAGLAGCRMTPEEIERIRTENVLLREQIQTVRENCEYYRELDVRPADDPDLEEEADPPGPPG